MRIATIIVSGCLFLTAGCGGPHNPIDGKYQDAKSGGMLTFTFDRGKCDFTAMGFTKECTYQVTGNKVALTDSNGRPFMTLTIQADGSMIDDASGNRIIRSPQ